MQRIDGVTVATVDLEETDYQEYYNGYANKTLCRCSTTRRPDRL
jgi:trehalose 6-phosphate synthase